MIECNIENCKKRYIGESERTLKDRISEHIGYVRTNKHGTTTGNHFNEAGHSVANLTATVLEKVRIMIYLTEKKEKHTL